MGPISVLSKSETEIKLVWSALTGSLSGDSPITAYSLYWDDGTGVINILLTKDYVLNYHVRGTIGGTTYQFTVTAWNVYGEGQSSEVLVQIASDVPDQILMASTSI